MSDGFTKRDVLSCLSTFRTVPIPSHVSFPRPTQSSGTDTDENETETGAPTGVEESPTTLPDYRYFCETLLKCRKMSVFHNNKGNVKSYRFFVLFVNHLQLIVTIYDK